MIAGHAMVQTAGVDPGTARGPSLGTRLPNESRRARLRVGERVRRGEWQKRGGGGEVSNERDPHRKGEPANEKRRNELGMIGSQEGVAEGDLPDILHEWILEEVAVDEEEDREVNLLPGQDPLLLEAEALYFGKVGRDLSHAYAKSNQRLPSWVDSLSRGRRGGCSRCLG